MSPLALSLSMLSGLGWAGLDAARKRLGERGCPPAAVVLLLAVGTSACFGAWLTLRPPAPVPASYLEPLAVVVVCNVAANLLLMRSVTLSPLSKTIPLLSLHPVFCALFAIPLLGERPSPWQWIGIAAVVLGAITLNARSGLHPRTLWSDLRAERGALPMALAALSWAVASPYDKRALGLVSIPVHLLAVNVGLTVVMLAILLRQRALGSLRQLARQPWVAGASLACVLLGVVTQFRAYEISLVASVETVKRMLGLLSALVLGNRVFGEPIERRTVVVVVLLGIGVALVATG